MGMTSSPRPYWRDPSGRNHPELCSICFKPPSGESFGPNIYGTFSMSYCEEHGWMPKERFHVTCPSDQSLLGTTYGSEPSTTEKSAKYTSFLSRALAWLSNAYSAAQADYEQRILSALSPSIASLQAENERLREALTIAANQLHRVHEDAFKQCAGYGLVTSDGRDFSCFEINRCEEASGAARAALGGDGTGYQAKDSGND